MRTCLTSCPEALVFDIVGVSHDFTAYRDELARGKAQRLPSIWPNRQSGCKVRQRGNQEACLKINVREPSDNNVHVIQLRGDLKLGDPVDGLRQACLCLMSEGENRFVINLTEVPMIDSSGIGVLVRTLTQAKQHGGSLKLVNPSQFALQTLKIVGLLSLFELFDDETQAIQSFQ